MKHTPGTWDALERVMEQDTVFIEARHGIFAEAFRMEKERWVREYALDEAERSVQPWRFL